MTTSARTPVEEGHRKVGYHLESAVVLAATACWSGVAVARYLGMIHHPSSTSAFDGFLVALPLLLATRWSFSASSRSLALRWAAAWSAVLAGTLLLVPLGLRHQTLVLAAPGLIALTWLVHKRPAVGVVAILAVTASFGSLHVYLSFPYKKAIFVILAALALAALVPLFMRRPRRSVQLPLGVTLAIAYLVISLIQVALSNDQQVGLGGLELAPLYMTPMLVVAYARWSRDTQARIVNMLLMIAALVGAYAVLRLIVGPSHAERALARQSAYNFVNGKQKLIGSFVSGPDLAEWTCLMIPFCAACALGARGRTRTIARLALPLLAIALFGSLVRAPAVAAGLAALVTALLHGRSRAFLGARIGQTAIALALTLAIGLTAYSLAGSGHGTSGHSYLALLTANSHDVSVSYHEYKWQVALRDLTHHPFGYGLGTAPSGYTANAPRSQYILPVTQFRVDNGFLKVALEQGFSVMVVFVLALVLLCGTLVRRGLATRDPFRATVGLGAAGTAASLLVLEGAGAFADGVPAIMGWIVIGLGLAQFVARERSPGTAGAAAQARLASARP